LGTGKQVRQRLKHLFCNFPRLTFTPDTSSSPLLLLQFAPSSFGEAMSSAGGQRQYTAVSLSCSFLLSPVLCSSMGRLWATVPSAVYLLWHGPIHSHSPLREVPALPQSTSSSSDLVIPSVLPSSSPFPCCLHVPSSWHFLPFSKYALTEIPPTRLMGSAVACDGPLPKTAGSGCVWHRTAPGLLLQRPCLQPPCCQNLAFYIQYSL